LEQIVGESGRGLK